MYDFCKNIIQGRIDGNECYRPWPQNFEVFENRHLEKYCSLKEPLQGKFDKEMNFDTKSLTITKSENTRVLI